MSRSLRLHPTPCRSTDSLDRRFTMYALAAGAAGVSAVALAVPADARIIYTPARTRISPPHTIPLDLNQDGKSDFKFQDTFSTTSAGFFREGVLSIFPEHANEIWGHATARGGHYASALSAGVPVSSKGAFSSGPRSLAYGGREGTSVFCEGKWYGSHQRYLGLKFNIRGKTHFGWARLNVNCGPPEGKTHGLLTGYAYETVAGKPILTGDKKGPADLRPDPAGLGQLARGASGRPR